MSTIMEYIRRTTDGMEQFLGADKTVVLLLAVLLLFGLQEKSAINKNGNKLLTYTLLTTILLLCPFTAVLGVMYQTAFYDYEWLWSIVPVTIVLSYAGVLLFATKAENANRKQKFIRVTIFLVLLFWCGNQGTIKTASSEEIEQRREAQTIIENLQQPMEGELILWAPKYIMQETRRRTGTVGLVYGRDMWDAQSGAYDYEKYSEEMVSAYEWIEELDVFIGDGEVRLDVLEVQWERKKMDMRLQELMPFLLDKGVNVIVIPIETAPFFESKFFAVAEEKGLEVEETPIESYMLYRLK